MENNTPDYVYDNVIQVDEADSSRKFIANVFLWMFVALGLSAFFAYSFASDPKLFAMVRGTGLGLIVGIAPIAFILIFTFGFNRLSYAVSLLLFIAFAVTMGISLSYIFFAYSLGTIYGVFITTSVTFGVMAIAGYTTHQDLTRFGGIMIMLLIGIIIASIVNIFIQSSGMYMLITYIGVAVFVGLTAYDVQKLKRIGAGIEYGDASTKKLAIWGALNLYLDFVNLFLMLLRVFGRRR